MTGLGKSLFLYCLLVLLPPAIAGFISNDKESLRESFQKQNWDDVVLQADKLIDSSASDSQKDLYRLLQAMALFQQMQVDECIAVLEPIGEQSLYYTWAKLFLARLAYVSDNRRVLESSLQGLNKANLKGEIRVEAKFYDAYLLMMNVKWSAAEKVLKTLERQSRGGEVHSSILESQALVYSHISKYDMLCKTLEKIYVKYPKHIWFEAVAPEIKNIKLGKKQYTCAVSDKAFEARRRNLNLMGEFTRVNNEIQKWFQVSHLSIKKQKILLAQQSAVEGHPEIAVKTLQGISDYKSDLEVLNPLSFAAARAGDMTLAIDTSMTIHRITGFSKKGSMALYQAALWSYQMKDYENAEMRFKLLKPHRLSRAYQKEVQWYLGWLRYLRGDFLAAEKSFRMLMKTRKGRSAGDANDRLNYWLAMTQLQNGKRDKARVILTQLSERKGMNYYSFLARERLKLIPDTPAKSTPKVEVPQLLVLAQSLYLSPFTENAPQPNAQEVEEEEMTALTSLEDGAEESATVAAASAEEENKTATDTPEETTTDAAEVTNAATPVKESDAMASEVFTRSESLLKIERAKSFWSVGLDELARREVSDLENSRTSFELLKKITEEYRAMGLYNRLSSLGHDFVNKADLNSNKFIYEAIYPKAYAEYVDTAATETNVAKSLIWGIMKAESMYRPWVKSPVGALGLMQVMPTTGQRLADLLDYKNFSPQALLKPEDAIRFGSKYLERLGKKFDHTVQLVAAAYNAGPHRVSQWLYYFGYMQMDEWVEHIPFLETRNYVKRVTVNYMAYNELYGKGHGQELALIGPVPVQLAGAPETKENWE